MPGNSHKAAAVPFVNQKGERSMKRVKVERYVAGKRPHYAKDEEEEYYTTDEEEEFQEDEQAEDEEYERKSEDESCDNKVESTSRMEPSSSRPQLEDSDDDDDDDDPRFRRLKQLEKSNSEALLKTQTSIISSHIVPKVEDGKVVIDDDEDEEEIRQRHAIARARQLEEPIGPQHVLAGFSEPQPEVKQEDVGQSTSKRLDTDDILKDIKLTGFKPKELKAKETAQAEQRIKEMIEKAREETLMKAELHKKIEEDNKRDAEILARGKDGISMDDMNSVITDDEDEEIAYQEWTLREIKRVLRDRSAMAARNG